jgi:hypothetical protein
VSVTSLVECLFNTCDSLQIEISATDRVTLAVRCDGEQLWARTSCSKRGMTREEKFQECFNRLFEPIQPVSPVEKGGELCQKH